MKKIMTFYIIFLLLLLNANLVKADPVSNEANQSAFTNLQTYPNFPSTSSDGSDGVYFAVRYMMGASGNDSQRQFVKGITFKYSLIGSNNQVMETNSFTKTIPESCYKNNTLEYVDSCREFTFYVGKDLTTFDAVPSVPNRLIQSNPGGYKLKISAEENTCTRQFVNGVLVDGCYPPPSNTNCNYIQKIDDLQGIKNNLNGCFLLQNDIDASALNFTPIGTAANPFTGTLDGQGFSIKNLQINQASNDDVGMFGVINGGTIKNLKFENAKITGRNYTGIIGEATNATLQNLSVNATVTGQNYTGGLAGYLYQTSADTIVGNNLNVTGQNYTGGITGLAYHLTIAKAAATGTVKGGNYTGGITSYFYQTSASNINNSAVVSGGDYVGGIAAINNNTSLTNSESKGVINGNNYIGGISGYNYSTNIQNSRSDDKIKGNDDVGGIAGYIDHSSVSNTSSYADLTSTGKDAGGLVGGNDYGDINSSYAESAVSGAEDVGGLVGAEWNNSSIENSLSKSKVISSMKNAGGLIGYNEGTITNSESDATVELEDGAQWNVGGFAGHNYGGDISNSISKSTVTSAGWNTGGFIGINEIGNLENDDSESSVSLTNHSVWNIGGFAGYNTSNGTIDLSKSISTVTSKGQENGGFVGDNQATIKRSMSKSAVNADDDFTGGFAGTNESIIDQSYAEGTVTNSPTSHYTGGFVGDNAHTIDVSMLLSGSTAQAHITNSYSTASVTGANGVGSFAGSNMDGNSMIKDSYAIGNVNGNGTNIGGLVGTTSGSGTKIMNSYWDTQTVFDDDAEDDGSNGIAATTAAMTQQTTYSKWDFTSIWGINSTVNNGFPYLQALAQPQQQAGVSGTVGTTTATPSLGFTPPPSSTNAQNNLTGECDFTITGLSSAL